jgi:hypothetical protein
LEDRAASVFTLKTIVTWHHNPEDLNLGFHFSENLKSLRSTEYLKENINELEQ